jgi:hypothetical protein
MPWQAPRSTGMTQRTGSDRCVADRHHAGSPHLDRCRRGKESGSGGGRIPCGAEMPHPFDPVMALGGAFRISGRRSPPVRTYGSGGTGRFGTDRSGTAPRYPVSEPPTADTAHRSRASQRRITRSIRTPREAWGYFRGQGSVRGCMGRPPLVGALVGAVDDAVVGALVGLRSQASGMPARPRAPDQACGAAGLGHLPKIGAVRDALPQY